MKQVYTIAFVLFSEKSGLSTKTIDISKGITQKDLNRWGGKKILSGLMKLNKNPEIIDAILYEGSPEEGKELAHLID